MIRLTIMLMALMLFSASAQTPGPDWRGVVIAKTNYGVVDVKQRARSPAPVFINPPSVEGPKMNKPKCRKGEKQWRTLKGGHRKYRLRRTC